VRPFRRRTKTERQRDRVEGAWVRQQQEKAVEPMQTTAETLLARGYREVAIGAVCEKHPEYNPARWLDVQPRSPLQCPHCLDAERREERKRERERSLARHTSDLVHFESPYTSERAMVAVEKWREQRDPVNTAGTVEHERACELLQEAHEDAVEKERKRSGRGGQLVCSRSEGGQLVEYRDMRRSIRSKPEIVRVAPS
jgi:hypothetical protein